MQKLVLKNKYLFIIIAVWVLFSAPFLFLGKTPFPSDYQVNFFSPWSSYPGMAGPVKNNAQPDIIGQIYPWRYFAIEELKNGRIPFWNPYSFSGTPHLANYQSAVLFPLNILFFLPLSFINIWSLLVVLQPLLAGIFTYFFLRKMNVSSPGSALSSLSFMFCGFIVTWLGYATLGFAILPLPIALYFVLSYISSKKSRWLILLSLTFPLSFFAGHFQTSLYFGLAVFAFIIYNLLFYKEKKLFILSLLYCLFGVLLTMPQVLPSMELYSVSFRSGLFQKFEAIPFNYLATLFSPDFFGNPVTRNDWFGHYAEWNGYAGIIPLAFALFVAFFARNKRTIFFLALSLASLLLAYDTPLLTMLVALKVPVLSTSAASRIIVLFSFSIAVLSGFGFDEVMKTTQRKKIVIWLLGIVGIFIIALFLGKLGISGADKMNVAIKNTVLPLALFSLLIFLVFVSQIIKKKYYFLILFLIVTLSAFEMYRFASKWQNFSPKNIVYKSMPVAHFYNSLNHVDRAIGLSGGEDAVYYRVPILSGYDPLYKSEYGELIKYAEKGESFMPDRSVVTFPLSGKFTPQLIQLLGVKYIVHKFSDGNFPWAFPFDKYPLEQFSKIYDDSHYMVFRNNSSFGRAFVVGNVISKKDKKDKLNTIFSNKLDKVAVLDENLRLDKNAKGTAKIIEYFPSHVKINVQSSGKALLVLTDNYFPGWKATVNGNSEKIHKVDYSFRGVVVPRGASIVTFSYTPESFLIGIYIMLLGILGIVTLSIIKMFGYKK